MPNPDRRRQNPSSILYWRDLRDDPNLRRCSPAAKGVWAVHMLPAAAESSERGVVIINGGQSRQQDLGSLLCREIGETSEATQALVDELVATGAASVDSQGRVYNRRMVREERLRQARAAAGRLGAAAKHRAGKNGSARRGPNAGPATKSSTEPVADGWQSSGKGSGKGVGKPPGKGVGKQGGNDGGKSRCRDIGLNHGGADEIRHEAQNDLWQTGGKGLASSLPSRPSRYDSEAKASGAAAPPAGLDDASKKLFGQGVDWLQVATRKSNAQCRALIGRWRKSAGDAVLVELLAEAQRQDIQAPEAWITAAIKERERQGTAGLMPKTADEAMEQFRADPAWRGVAA